MLPLIICVQQVCTYPAISVQYILGIWMDTSRSKCLYNIKRQSHVALHRLFTIYKDIKINPLELKYFSKNSGTSGNDER